jgi:hypothetical protein
LARHAYFEELCALAPLGELTPSQLVQFEEHITECEVCRQATIDYNRFFQRVVPAVTRSDEEYIESRKDDMRAAVMRNVGSIDQERDRPLARKKLYEPSLSAFLWGSRRGLLPLPLLGGLGAVTLTSGAFWIGAHFYGRVQSQKVDSASVTAPATPLPPVITQPPVTLRNSSEKELTEALDQARQRNDDLAEKLSVEEGKLVQAVAAQDALRLQIEQGMQALAATRAELDGKAAAVTQARSASSSDSATIAALELQVHDLSEKMNTQTANLDRERDLLSHGREIRDIIGARNLHIVDVYDTSTEGTTRRPFARAFYTEGKSLVYYAYDLPQRRVDEGRFSYVAWGQSNGSKASIKKIGILYHDDQSQRRWSLDFSDPQALKEIDSVFITMERSDEDLAQPKGKRMLTAYLATAPNHP